MGMTSDAAETLIARAWTVSTPHRLTGDHALVQAIWTLEDAIDFGDSDVDHAAERVETLIGELQ